MNTKLRLGLVNARGLNNVEHWYKLEYQELQKRGYEVEPFWFRGKPLTGRDTTNLDFLICHFTQIAQIYMRTGLPFCVLPSANDVFPDNGNRLKMVSRNRNCKFITYQSHYHLKKYKEWDIEGNFVYVPMPVRVDTFKRNRKYNPNEKYLAGGRLIPKKGIHQLKSVQDNLRIFGDGPLRRDLEIELPRAEFLGELDAKGLKNVMERSSVYLFPAVETPDGDHEGISNTIKEAMLMQLPVICSPIAGNVEFENVSHLNDWSNLPKVLEDFKFIPNYKGEKEIRNLYNPKHCVDLLLKGIEQYG